MTSNLSSVAKDTLKDCAKYAIFDQTGAVLAANYQVVHLLLCLDSASSLSRVLCAWVAKL